MQLREEGFGASLFVRRCDARSVTVVDRVFEQSFVLATNQVVARWPVTDPREIGEEAVATVLALEPAVVLLGTGERLRFPHQAVLARFLTRGIGIEVMDNAAAARTFNVLAGEGRRVVAAFVLAPGP